MQGRPGGSLPPHSALPHVPACPAHSMLRVLLTAGRALIRSLDACNARRSDPVDDAAVVLAVRQAVGPSIALHADANRAWTLDQAVAFGHHAASAQLAYVEEPTQDPADMAAFFMETGGWRWRAHAAACARRRVCSPRLLACQGAGNLPRASRRRVARAGLHGASPIRACAPPVCRHPGGGG